MSEPPTRLDWVEIEASMAHVKANNARNDSSHALAYIKQLERRVAELETYVNELANAIIGLRS